MLHYFTLHYKIYLKKYSSKQRIPLTIHPHQLRPIVQSFNVPKQRHFRWTFRFFPSRGRARVFVISFTPETVGKSATKWIHRPDEDAGPFRKSDVEGVYSAVIFTSRRDALPRLSPSLSYSISLSLSLCRPVLPEDFGDPRRGRGGRAAPCWQEADAKSCPVSSRHRPGTVARSLFLLTLWSLHGETCNFGLADVQDRNPRLTALLSLSREWHTRDDAV